MKEASIVVAHCHRPAQVHPLYQRRAAMTLVILYMNESVTGIYLTLLGLTIRLAIHPPMDIRMPLWVHPLIRTFPLPLFPRI